MIVDEDRLRERVQRAGEVEDAVDRSRALEAALLASIEHPVTFNEHGAAMLKRIEELGDGAAGSVGSGPIMRDLALARTHLEDALTRFNSAVYRVQGTWDRADAERVTGLVAPL